MQILRYDTRDYIVTDLNPIEDILNLITVLKSNGFTSDMLRTIHKFTDAKEIKKVSKLISLHTDIAVSLADQAFTGSPETSFLPLYYSTLNLSKILLLFLGKRTELELNRWHGASYLEKEMRRDFLNEEIVIKPKGTIPLIYSSITGKSIGRALKVSLDELYPYISGIGAEYTICTNKAQKLMAHETTIIRDDANGHYLHINVFTDNYIINPPITKKIKAYPSLIPKTPANPNHFYETKKIKGRYETIERNLLSSINRYLNSDSFFGNSNKWISYTPISSKEHVFNEDLCIMLAYFHLSNVVRYNPEHLNKIMDSKYWIILLALRKHGYLRFLKLMWGNFNKKVFDTA
ncbi:MAG: hypothetical protein M3367_14840 [Acidobacteriota bacterium]|nr:hypothetical protein [Acidobacteriota bacterium]